MGGDVQRKKQQRPAGKKRRPGGGGPPRPKPQQQKAQGVEKAFAGKKRKAAADPPAKPTEVKESGDVDDFEHLLDDMEDYRPGADEAYAGSGGESDLEPAGEDGQQPVEGGSAAAAAAGRQGQTQGQEGKKVKRRRKKGQKLSSMEFEASREMAKQIADCSGEEQADWLWASFQQHAAATTLERGGLTAAGMQPLPTQGSLEDRLKALQPTSWQQEFCGRPGGGPGRQQRPPGSPSLLLVSPSAMGAVSLTKLCPQFNQSCRIGKLFAKHMKVAEQEEALSTQVMCIAAGTPNRLCKLADVGALKLSRLLHVVVDVQLDVKQRDILAIPETRADWWQLFDRHLKERLAAGSLKLSLVNSDRLTG